ncbi:MAG TPA: A/G-specific adenine glycosylase [Patescibacteria group bacterium]|nr:A/G-specific adenine glycosylase [Patescibacteria group bacterium]
MTLAPAELQAMHAAVLGWYAVNARDLAFRRSADPWSVLLSEVIAQQTQAARAATAWTRLIARFPTPTALAAASPATAIRAWRGLGYNRRALALREAAIAILEEHDGHVPDTFEDLVRLPGIGPYTARAILAIAFGRDVAALDTNIRRVVSRAVAGGVGAIRPTELQALADELVPHGRGAAWTHALMDVGAAYCRKGDPRCEACPLAEQCRYLAAGRPPERSASRPAPKPFATTSRWLRGRILDQLRDAPEARWVSFGKPIGGHAIEAVQHALTVLAREQLLELDPARRRARLKPA